MRDDIKKRIEAVRLGEVPEGYSCGMAGVLPNDWACMPLSEISVPITEQVGNRTIETLSISAGIGFVNQAEKFGKELSGKQYEKYIVLRRGDFAYNKGNSKSYPQGCTYMLREREEAAVPNVFECFRFTQGHSAYYEHLFKNGFLNRQLTRKINHGVRDDGLLNLTDKDFYSTVLPVPPDEEQKRIAEVLSSCDRVIELKQKLVEELRQLKKICLAKMFPQKGCTTPEIRFPGFTNPWEQRKLGELARLHGRIGFRGYTQKDIITKDEGGILTFSPSNIIGNQLDLYAKNTYITQAKYDESPDIKIKNGDILFVKTGSTLGKSALVTGLSEPASINPQIVVIRTKSELRQFLSTQLVSDLIQAQVAAVKIGGAVPTMTETEIKDLDILVPVDSDESAVLGDFFSDLDSLITHHQCELEEVQQKKKALMQLLLTGLVRVND